LARIAKSSSWWLKKGKCCQLIKEDFKIMQSKGDKTARFYQTGDAYYTYFQLSNSKTSDAKSISNRHLGQKPVVFW
jgi:hypothetical protein